MKLNASSVARWAHRALAPLSLALILALQLASSAAAAEGGSLPFPSGLFTQNAAIVPAPGSTYLLLYTLALDSSKLAGPQGQSALPGFHVDAVGQATRVLHTWNLSVDGMHFSTGVSPVFQVIDTDRGSRNYLAGSLRQVYVTPLAMTRQVGPLHLLLSEDLFVGVGQHTPDNPASTALGYTSFNTIAAATFVPSRYWDANVTMVYGKNTRDTLTKYLSGDYLNIDFGGIVTPFREVPQLAFGFGGYYADQLTGDRRFGVTVPGGDRLRQLDIGPGVRWTFGPGLSVVLKWQHPLETRNSAEGERYWLQIAKKL